MLNLLKPVSSEIFNNNVSVRFKNILEGFNSFPNLTLDFNELNYSEDKIISLIQTIYDENNEECYFDFYINNLSPENIKKLITLVDQDDRKILTKLVDECSTNGPYYKLLSKDLIPLLTRLNTRSIFFVTFYFTERPITIWGNYDLKFPCFFEHESDLKFYNYYIFKKEK